MATRWNKRLIAFKKWLIKARNWCFWTKRYRPFNIFWNWSAKKLSHAINREHNKFDPKNVREREHLRYIVHV